MDIYRRKLIWKALLLVFAVLIGLGSLFYTSDLVARLKKEERKKAEQWAEATKRLVGLPLDSQDLDFLFGIIENNNTVPVILIDEQDNIVSHRNLPAAVSADTLTLVSELRRMGKLNEPIVIDLGNGASNYLYFRESMLLRQLRIYPYIQLGIILLFVTVAYVAFSASRSAEQNQVWVGLSRETAHQLGTPASSLSGWAEIIKTRYPDTDISVELSADVERLARVAERFSLIGSKPKMQPTELKDLVESSSAYLKKRIASTVKLRISDETEGHSTVPANAVLLGWVIENLVKNSADAMKGSGEVTIRISDVGAGVAVDVEDTGKGILKKNFKSVFKPGYTTREHGWGLGLSLAKRIIEEYHKGKIFVRYSEPGKGTCMRVLLKKS